MQSPTVQRDKPSTFRVLAIYLGAVFLGGALLAPWVWHWMQVVGSPAIASKPFHRYVNRCFYLIAVLGLWPLIQGLRVPGMAGLGWTPIRRGWPGLGRGFLVGWISLATVAVVALVCGGRVWVGTNQLLTHLVFATGAAVGVAVLEELLFRGVIWTSLMRSWGPVVALWVSSVLYSSVHFFQKPPPPDSINAFTGLTTLGRMLIGFTEYSQLFPGFLSLLLVGMILARARERTESLWWSIGLHAGWIFWLKSYSHLCGPAPDAKTVFWGTNKLYDGWVALVGIGVAGLLVERCTASKNRNGAAEG